MFSLARANVLLKNCPRETNTDTLLSDVMEIHGSCSFLEKFRRISSLVCTVSKLVLKVLYSERRNDSRLAGKEICHGAQ